MALSTVRTIERGGSAPDGRVPSEWPWLRLCITLLITPVLRGDGRVQLDEAFQVLRQRRQQRLLLHSRKGSQSQSPQAHELLRLAEQLLDLLSVSLRQRVAPTAGLALRAFAPRLRPLLDRGRRTGDVRLDPAPPEAAQETRHEVALVRSQRPRGESVAPLEPRQHLPARLGLGTALRLRRLHVQRQPAPIVHRVVHVIARVRSLSVTTPCH